jgi:hypothetical protein
VIDMQLKTDLRGAGGETWLAGALETTYTTWRDANQSVQHAYRGWIAAPRDERRLAYEIYVAALDWEEHAARAYQDLVEEGARARAAGAT